MSLATLLVITLSTQPQQHLCTTRTPWFCRPTDAIVEEDASVEPRVETTETSNGPGTPTSEQARASAENQARPGAVATAEDVHSTDCLDDHRIGRQRSGVQLSVTRKQNVFYDEVRVPGLVSAPCGTVRVHLAHEFEEVELAVQRLNVAAQPSAFMLVARTDGWYEGEHRLLVWAESCLHANDTSRAGAADRACSRSQLFVSIIHAKLALSAATPVVLKGFWKSGTTLALTRLALLLRAFADVNGEASVEGEIFGSSLVLRDDGRPILTVSGRFAHYDFPHVCADFSSSLLADASAACALVVATFRDPRDILTSAYFFQVRGSRLKATG